MTTIRHLWFLRRGTAMAAIGQETMRGGANVLSRGLDGQLMIDPAVIAGVTGSYRQFGFRHLLPGEVPEQLGYNPR